MSVQEDDLVTKLVGELGTKKWSQIASQLEGRLGKQCRERCVCARSALGPRTLILVVLRRFAMSDAVPIISLRRRCSLLLLLLPGGTTTWTPIFAVGPGLRKRTIRSCSCSTRWATGGRRSRWRSRGGEWWCCCYAGALLFLRSLCAPYPQIVSSHVRSRHAQYFVL